MSSCSVTDSTGDHRLNSFLWYLRLSYRFRQASNLFYLTGFTEPDAALVLEKESGSSRRGYKMTLFVSGREELHEAWNGPRTGTDGAVDVFGADDAIEMDSEGRSLLDYLKDVLPDASKIYHDPALAPTIPRKPSRSAGTSVGSSSGSSSLLNYLSPGSPSSFDIFSRKTDFDNVIKLLGDSRRSVDLSSAILDRHRLVKSPSELRLMRRAGHIAGLAHNSTMRFSNMYRGHDAGASEWAMQAHFEYTAALLGASRPAYVPVVAGGERGCTIHYTDNDHLVAGTQEVAGGDGTTGQLVTMDAGIEYAGYNSDITRAWPVASRSAGSSGEVSMTPAQLDLYSALLRVLKTCSSLAVAQNGYSLSSLHRRSVELLAAELKDLGFQLSVGELERVFYPHYLGHYLGLDLHDTPSIARTQPLKPGMVVTIEPGLYIPSEDSVMGKSLRSRIPKEYRGIGLRVEDDVAIGERENVILSVEAVKEVDDVLKVCQGWEADHSADAVQGGSRSVLGAEVERMLARGPQGTGL